MGRATGLPEDLQQLRDTEDWLETENPRPANTRDNKIVRSKHKIINRSQYILAPSERGSLPQQTLDSPKHLKIRKLT